MGDNVGDYLNQYLSDYWPWHLVLLPLVLFIWIYPLWRIIGRAGYPPAISLLAVFPAVGLILLWWLAFSRWPVERNSEPAAVSGPANWASASAPPHRRG